MVQFRTNLETVRKMQEMMQRWMSDGGQGIEVELSNNLWVQRLGDFARSLDLDALATEYEADHPLVCELGGRGPTQKAVIYRFICRPEDKPESPGAIMDVEESICDRVCRGGLWEVIPGACSINPKSPSQEPRARPSARRPQSTDSDVASKAASIATRASSMDSSS